VTPHEWLTGSLLALAVGAVLLVVVIVAEVAR